MSIKVETRIEGRRGCGYRKPGGIYLVGPPFGMSCCKLPFPLTTCPCCGAGIRPARGWTWVDADKLFFPDGPDDSCHDRNIDDSPRLNCPLSQQGIVKRAGLIWVGEQYYKTPEDFLAEARLMGISRRITNIPKDFKLGETWVLLAHRKAIITLAAEAEQGELVPINKYQAAIFSVFRPTAIEYVIKGDETDEQLERVVKRGMTPIRVNPRRAYS